MPNTNFQTFHQMGNAISNVVKQASGRDPVQNIDMDFVTVAQNKTLGEMSYTGNPLSFNTPRPVQIQRILLGMNPIQSGSGDPSPSNVRPITGRTGVNVSRSGKNLFDPDGYTASDISPIYGSNGSPLDSARSGIYIYLPPGTYTMSQNRIGTQYVRGNVLDSNNEFVSYFSLSTNTVNTPKTFTVEEGQKVCIYKSTTTSGSLALRTSQFMLEVGSVGHEYEEFSGTTIPVTFPDPPGTVYKGTLDLISGQLTVTHLMQTFTGAESEEWLNTYESNGFRIASIGMKIGLLNPGLCNWLPILSEVGNEMGVALGMNDSDIYVRHITDNLEIADLTEWRAYLAQHPLEVFYPLEPAQYYQVTPQGLNTLAGDNVVYTDGDTLEVMYYQYGEV